MSDVIESFISAQNFCTGSQSDYSTCIANNMRFTEFLDDTYKESQFAGLSIKNSAVPYLYGDVFVDLQAVAVANILSRVKMTNDYGVVSFRCSEVFDRPSLPLPKLQDLGIPAQDIINIIGVDTTDPDPEDSLIFEGVPLSQDDTLTGWMINCINLLIGYTTAVSNSMNKGQEITGIIYGSLNYYELPDLSIEMRDEFYRSDAIYNKFLEYSAKIQSEPGLNDIVLETAIVTEDLASKAYVYSGNMSINIQGVVVNPLAVINPNTDFTTFNFDITDGVAETISSWNTDYYPFALSFGYAAKQISSLYGIPPVYPIDDSAYANKVITLFSGLFANLVSEMLGQIKALYGLTTTLENALDALEANEELYSAYKSYSNFYYTLARSYTNDEDYEVVSDQMNQLTSIFNLNYSGGYLPDEVLSVYDEEDYESTKLVGDELDTYFTDTGDVSSIELYNLIDKQKVVYGSSADDRITELTLGGNFKDSGNFYYADIAYAVGYGKLSDIKSIQIDDEYYELLAGVDADGVAVRGISEAGCTRYSFTRHVLPTYDVEVEMYVYPGMPDQPHCPTINKYHNFLTTKYYGMFTKQDGDTIGVYVYRGYKPMYATVEEVIKLGSVDLNSINLNDPSIDQQSYETMLQREVKNLTNASTINGSPLTTDDFKYYLSSQLVYDQEAANYPGLAIIEFKNFPIGNSIKMPKIKVNVVSEDLAL